MQYHLRNAATALAALTLAACASQGTTNDEPVALNGGGIVRIAAASEEDIEHACFHAQDPGSYELVDAVTSGSAPSVDDHVSYDITLPGSGPYSGYVSWLPGGSGSSVEHAIYTDPTVTIAVYDVTASQSVAVYWSDPDITELCAGVPGLPDYGTTAGLTAVATYLLNPTHTHRVTFTRTGAPEMLAIFERL